MPLPQGVTIEFTDSGFSADLLTISMETVRGDYEITTFTDMYHATDAGDLIDGGRLNLGVGFDANNSPPVDGDAERINITWLKTGSQTRGALWYFDGFFVQYNPGAVVDEYMTAQIEIQITGEIIRRLGQRGCRVAPSGQADYTSSTAADQVRYGWIADNATQQMSNGDDPYLVMPRGTN